MRISLNPLMYLSSKTFEFLLERATEEPLKIALNPGKYYVAGRSGGGAGSDGAGGVGQFFENDFSISQRTNALAFIGDGGKIKDEGGNGGDYNEFVQLFTLTINPTPADAIVTLTAAGALPASERFDLGHTDEELDPDSPIPWMDGNTDGEFTPEVKDYMDLGLLKYQQEGNSITVAAGTYVTYKVEKEGHETVIGSFYMNDDQTLDITLQTIQKVLTINPTSLDATVQFNTGVVADNTTTVPYGTTVTYLVSKDRYTTVTDTIKMVEDTTRDVNLVQHTALVTINPTPSDATVILTCPGFTQDNNSIYVDTNSTVLYEVSKTGYTTQSNSIIANSDKYINVELEIKRHTITINPNPSDATVTLTSTGETQVGYTITVNYGAAVLYTVEQTGYESISGSIQVTQDQTIDVELVSLNPTLVTTNTTKTLKAGTYKAILISAGGDGALGTQAAVQSYGAPGGGGGGSGKVSIVTFTTTGENITFNPATVSGGTTTLSGNILGTIASIEGGSSAVGANGGNGGSGGGSGGNSAAGTTAIDGGAGGIGGHDGYNGSAAAGIGVNGTSMGGSANNSSAAGTSSGIGNPGIKGIGASNISSTLLSIEGFNAATVNSVLASMAGGGAGSGGYLSRAATMTGGAGAGGGGWFDGTNATGGAASQQSAGIGGSGAIIYMKIS